MDFICGQQPFWVDDNTTAVTHDVIYDVSGSPFPDLPACFQDTVLTWVPLGYLLLGAPLDVFYVRGRCGRRIARTWLNSVKTLLALCLAVLAMVDFIKQLVQHSMGHVYSPAKLSLPALVCLTMVICAGMVELERRRGLRSSYFLTGFWILATASAVIRFRSALHKQIFLDDVMDFVTQAVACSLSCTQLVLCFMVDAASTLATTRGRGNPLPSGSANIFSRLFVCWPIRLIWKGFRASLVFSDFWDLKDSVKATYNSARLETQWKKQLQKASSRRQEDHNGGIPMKDMDMPDVEIADEHTGTPSLLLAILRTYWVQYMVGVLTKMAIEIFVFMTPQLLRLLIQFSQDYSQPMWKGYMLAAACFLVTLSQCLLQQHHNNLYFITGHRIRSTMMSLVYRKSLRLTNASKKDSTTGEIVNLMSTDCPKYMELMHYLNTVWQFPLQMALALYFLWQLVGASCLVGLAVLSLVIPINIAIARINKKLQKKQLKYQDERVKVMNEIISGIKVLKLHAWEPSFERKLGGIRGREIAVLRKQIMMTSISNFSFNVVPFMVTLATFAAYTLSSEDHVLTAERAFVSLSLFHILRMPIHQLPHLISNIVQCHVSHNRLYKFLLLEELQPRAIMQESTAGEVRLQKGHFAWDKTSKATLTNMNVEVAPGSLVAVVGSVGAGKSSLLAAMLAEMVALSGTVSLQGSVAYVPQQAWIQQATLKDNVTFNKAVDNDLYRKVIAHCALQSDINILPSGDDTEVGERGITLSGGQKLRVSLARAVYQEADLYLLDDPLSAVDAHVGDAIFREVIGPRGMLKDKTRVIVTHALWFLPHVDMIYVISDGAVAESGDYAQLMSRQGLLYDLVDTYETRQKHGDSSIAGSQEIESPTGSDGEPAFFTSAPDGLNVTPPTPPPRDPRRVTFSHSLSVEETSSSCRNRRRSLRHAVLNRPLILEGFHNSTSKTEAQSVDNITKSFTALSQSSLLAGSCPSMDETLEGLHIDAGEIEQIEQCAGAPPLADKKQSEATNGEQPKKKVEEGEAGEKEDHKASEKDTLLVREESVEKGRVKTSVYALYFRAVGLLPAVVVLLLSVSQRGLDIGAGLWLTNWSDGDTLQSMCASDTGTMDHSNVSSSDQPTISTFAPTGEDSVLCSETNAARDRPVVTWLAVYATLGLSQAVISSVKQATGLIAGLAASQRQHDSMLSRVLAAPMEFFDRTPTGRILNRFSSDVATLDNTLPSLCLNMLFSAVTVLGSVVLIAVVNPWSLIAWAILGTVYGLAQALYVPTKRQSQRLISVTRSPIYAYFGESLAGVATIRAYQQQSIFINEIENRLDKWSQALMVTSYANRWLCILLDSIGVTSVFMATMLAVTSRETLSPGMVGLLITYAMQITSSLNWLVRFAGMLEAQIVAVERMKQYITMEIEAPRVVESHRPANDWPSSGTIVLDDLCLRYRKGLDLVLKGITCKLKPAEKVGIVGRTGAGKSSLTLALFRMVEAASGTITIDDISIGDIGLHDLRSKLTIIPQDPVLFSGTLRFNLDPFEAHTDVELWRSLELAHLAAFVATLPERLDHVCSEGGENLSVGQRQLVCLARALLRKTKVLVLDEATASCDVDTDALIQTTIREEFRDSTVLTVAHRINTVLDYDRILVLDGGLIKELDSPANLLADTGTVFFSLARQAGLV